MKQSIEETRAKAAKRQADRKVREAKADRVRRGHYATPNEHASIVAHLAELRAPS